MEYTHPGRSGLSVSRLCLGTMNFGSLTPPGDAHAIMDRAHDLGLNFFDTANTYGRRQSPPGQVADSDQSHAGWTEEILGDWFALGGGRREKTVPATKLYGDMGSWPNEGKLLHQDGVTAPIIGPRTLEQLDSAQRALELRLDGDVLARLDEIFPGYKTAPEHYAW
jgi:aryl-alcohol dehydrogenase-like predicted oxidoreductase